MSKNTIKEAMQKLGATDGHCGLTWDPEILTEAAEYCLSGRNPTEFSGAPTEMREYERFAKTWREIQACK